VDRGDFVEADNPNQNKQFWTKDDLALGEYSIKYAPLNMLHKQRTPIGFFASTRSVNMADKASKNGGTMKIEALSGMWSHVFPFESALVDQADDVGACSTRWKFEEPTSIVLVQMAAMSSFPTCK
jgi:hypothetical protein